LQVIFQKKQADTTKHRRFRFLRIGYAGETQTPRQRATTTIGLHYTRVLKIGKKMKICKNHHICDMAESYLSSQVTNPGSQSHPKFFESESSHGLVESQEMTSHFGSKPKVSKLKSMLNHMKFNIFFMHFFTKK